MGMEFFDDLGATLSKTAKEFGVRAESIYETQKLRSKISGEERAIRQLMADLGRTIYRVYAKDGEMTDEQRELCEKIDHHMELISRCKAEMAGKRGKRICPSCKETLDNAAAFCPYCGAACTTPEPEEEAGDVAAETVINDSETAYDEEVDENRQTAEDGAASPEAEAPGFCGRQEQKEEEQE